MDESNFHVKECIYQSLCDMHVKIYDSNQGVGAELLTAAPLPALAPRKPFFGSWLL